jgi:GNAT superfamily N-acetyltransferase
LGWSFSVIRDGFFDVEELFVQPQWRKRGYGTRLFGLTETRANQNGIPLRLWVPHADCMSDDNLSAFLRMAGRFGLRDVQEHPATWAELVVTK